MQQDDAKAKTLIVGLGKTGLSVARYLSHQGEQVAVVDSREQPPGLDVLQQELPDVAVFLGGFDEAVFAQADRLVISPGVALDTPVIAKAIDRGAEVIGDIELFVRAAEAPLVAITGSNGKSTVTTLLGEMAREAGRRVAVGGNLGEPALDLLDESVDLYVLELSSFQLDSTESLVAEVATVLNVSPDHMDRYVDLAAYTASKAKIFRRAKIGLYNADDDRVRVMTGSAQRWCFSLAEPSLLAGQNPFPCEQVFGLCERDGGTWLMRGEQALMPTGDLLMPGRHNLANALAALAMGSALGLELGGMCDVLRRFTGLPHRTQYVASHNGVRWFNDSKGTNVGACIAALKGLSEPGASRTILIAGGDCKGAAFDDLVPVIQAHARAVVLMGRDAPRIAEALGSCAEIRFAEDMDQAVTTAAGLAQDGDRVLLSPACASLDMYANYMARGEAFMAAVGRLLS